MAAARTRVRPGAAVALLALVSAGCAGGDVGEPSRPTAAPTGVTQARLTSPEMTLGSVADQVGDICSGLAAVDAALSAAGTAAGGDGALAVEAAADEAREQVRGLAAEAQPGSPHLQEALDDYADALDDGSPDEVGAARTDVGRACDREVAEAPVPVPPDLGTGG